MDYYRSLSPAERIQIVLWLREQHRIAHGLTNKFQRVFRVIKRTDLVDVKKEVE
ncbi:MAG TPA: hypothetical protein VFR12_10170 [Pyrinomonadaceae bacterium]|nr:hypothetical protein [Pyrinomonadaceae bacterium]